MKKVKIVHTADLHFDTPFKEVGEKQSKVNKEELKEVFMRIIHICKAKSVDILLLAGDIFDNLTLNRETLYFIENSFKELDNTRVFISPGNHDPYGNNSFYKLIKWPNNVHIFKGDIEKVYISELDINVWGAGFKEKYLRSSILNGFSEVDNRINLMVIHGELSNSQEGNEYNPITISDISNSGMDYIALGHRHGFSGINKEGSTFFAYSGCPQGRGFDELGDKGIIYGYVSKGAVDLDFVRTSKRNYEEVEVDISDSFGYEEVRNKILEAVKEEDRKENLYKLILKGEISEEFNIDEEILREKLIKDFYFCKVIDKTRLKLDLEEISRGYSVKGIFAKKLMKELEEAETEADKELIMMALKVGLASLSEDEVKIDDY
ncbi:metallophosphoesterase family protein [Clostridium sp. LP20]|uniref:metallophosphoesterase family protein n=1 Tax=Clostridium sp. LP20 TaxID=3418665 RepID=UPI003EE7F553